MKKWNRWILGVFAAALLCVAIPAIDKALPILRDRESFLAIFPKKEFRERMKRPAAPWMLEQIDRDLEVFAEKKITARAVEKTFERMCRVLGPIAENYHFRILDNKLYKFIPDGGHFSATDTRMEKGLKTLLAIAKLPDCDFILSCMDGIPESHLPKDFYLVDNPLDQAPVFAQSRKDSLATKYVVLIADQFCLSEKWHADVAEILNEEIGWDQKAPIAVWRGGLSDTGEPNDGRFVASYEKTPRFAVCRMGLEHPDVVDAGLNGLDCKELERIVKRDGYWKAPISKREQIMGKYLPVLDGHMCTYPGFQWRLLSGSVCLKQESDQTQWFYYALKPFVHYIPIKNDMSDLLEKVAWARAHDAEARAIGEAGKAFALENLMQEDVYYYLHLALTKYAKLQAIDFQRLKKDTEKDSRWKCIQYRKRLALQKSIQKLLHE